MDRPPEWLSTEQVARQIGMSPEWVRRQILAGRLRATVFKTGRRPTYRIDKRDLQDFLSRFSETLDRNEPRRPSV